MSNAVLTVCGTYTVDPVADAVDYWVQFLGLQARVEIAPYGQLFQQLLDPSSAFRSGRAGGNAVLLRWSDLFNGRPGGVAGVSWMDVQAQVVELAAALLAFDHAVPCLLLVGPENPAGTGAELFRRATAHLQTLLAEQPKLLVEDAGPVMDRYRVDHAYDAASDRFGHVPFTPSANAALGTRIARWHAALVRPPIKVVAVDADHTLWAGVVAEDGVDGVQMGEGHSALQCALKEQAEDGRLLCLLSKNHRQDVRDVFDRLPGMPLKWSHLTADRIDWNPKPANLRELVSGLDLGLDSVMFLDDSPVECAAMRAHCPEVTTLRVPTDPAELATFVEHLWLLDRPPATAEDRVRFRMYADNASRTAMRREATSLRAFLDGMELVVDIHPPMPGEHARLAQLTQRTNQFNASLLRCDERDVVDRDVQGFHLAVRARDRFGDYGIVGQVRGRAERSRLVLDLFMLSCRALGRGIEHRMLAAAGEHAAAQGLEALAVLFREGERNRPAARFLGSVFGAPDTPTPLSQDHWYQMPARRAAGVMFDPDHTASDDDHATHDRPGQTRVPAPVPAATDLDADLGTRYEHIAHVLTTGDRIRHAIAGRMRLRGDLDVGFIAPAPGVERQLADIWQEVLRVEPVGSHDRFQDLGGRSIHLVQVHRLLLERMGVALDITTLFQHPTVASLAAFLGARSEPQVTDLARQRGQQMRAARARAAQRAGAAS